MPNAILVPALTFCRLKVLLVGAEIGQTGMQVTCR